MMMMVRTTCGSMRPQAGTRALATPSTVVVPSLGTCRRRDGKPAASPAYVTRRPTFPPCALAPLFPHLWPHGPPPAADNAIVLPGNLLRTRTIHLPCSAERWKAFRSWGR
ncbi:uncharacterized protein K452DRAFT_120830 [Aplosporella prunicola CBS 121167]|uniref:Uncharacterized protein n=1 Tax=Aplosporella prunicola CBS 121167 TaxID=1176127 RepID=A0A6A6BQH4_9PEZI|nr:uncharacterized protein K452DRAFT_120830 [Aplosporella prunicola CBS 121167]KAF2145494.1 hypothetical protein K452DRAFT_120830 [Aplosporella prunicola CBS 121167]